MGSRSMAMPSALRRTALRPIANSPIRLLRKPPPTTRYSVSRHSFNLRKRRITVVSSWANSSTALCTTPAALGSPSMRSSASFFLLIFSLGVSPSGSFLKRLAPFVEEFPEGTLARLISDKARRILDLDIITLHLHARQHQGTMLWKLRKFGVVFGHGP